MTAGLRMTVCDCAKCSEWLNLHVWACIVCFMTSNEAEKRLVYDIKCQSQSVNPRSSKRYFLRGLASEKKKKTKNDALEEKKRKKMRPVQTCRGRLG